jgi:hypothetical protein
MMLMHVCDVNHSSIRGDMRTMFVFRAFSAFGLQEGSRLLTLVLPLHKTKSLQSIALRCIALHCIAQHHACVSRQPVECCSRSAVIDAAEDLHSSWMFTEVNCIA